MEGIVKIYQLGSPEEKDEQRSIELTGTLQSHGFLGCCRSYDGDDEDRQTSSYGIDNTMGIIWFTWKGLYHSLSFVEMKVCHN